MAYLMRLGGLIDDYKSFLHEQSTLDCLLKEVFDSPHGKTWDLFLVFSIYIFCTMEIQILYKSMETNLLYFILSYLSQEQAKTNLNAIKSIQQHNEE